MVKGILAAVAYVASILAANHVTETYGQVPIGLGMVTTAGTLFVGAALLLRNVIQDVFGRWPVVFAIVVGSSLSAFLSPELALASGAAFLLSELLDMSVYTPLRKKGYVRAVIPASFVGAVSDTALFLYLADFPVMTNMTGQVVGKYAVTLVTVAVIVFWRSFDQRSKTPLES